MEGRASVAFYPSKTYFVISRTNNIARKECMSAFAVRLGFEPRY